MDPDRDTGKTCFGEGTQCPSALLLVMAALRSRCGHYIFVMFLLSSSFLA